MDGTKMNGLWIYEGILALLGIARFGARRSNSRIWLAIGVTAVIGAYGCNSDTRHAGTDSASISHAGEAINLCAACNDGNPCTVDTCANPATGACSFAPAASTVPCDDKNECTTADHCDGAGRCVGGPVLDCNDNNPCTNDSCNRASGCGHTSNTSSCNDGDPCTTNDRCGGGGICAGTTRNCDDGNPCTTDFCNPSTGACVHVNNTDACSDGNACTSNDTCNAGRCVGGPLLNCNDNNPCTNDSCTPSAGCVHTNNSATCNDGDACTSNDVCANGICAGTTKACNDNNACTDDACNPATGCVYTNNSAQCDDGNVCTTQDACSNGVCRGGTPLDCNDNNPCTNDSCNKVSGCTHANNSASCNDNDVCTTGDHCGGGVCSGTPRVCNDGNPCTDDTCTPGVGCVYSNNTATCNDGNPCTPSDRCSGGSCVGSGSTNCDDNNPCTNDTCNPSTGCMHSNNTAACTDNNPCTLVDLCSNGSCAGSGTANTDDGNPCTNDACDPHLGVVHTNKAAGSSCSDGNPCNGDELCNAAAQCTPGEAPVLDDGDPCTADSCDPALGIIHATIAGCGNTDQPLPPPPIEIDGAPATVTVGGVEFIDPHHALDGLAVDVVSLGSIASTDLSGADNVWSFTPSGMLSDVVYARIPLSTPLPASTELLLWTRPGSSGSFHVQSVGRVNADGTKAVVALTHFSQQTLVPLNIVQQGAVASTTGASGPFQPHQVTHAPVEGTGSFMNVLGLSATDDGRVGFSQTRLSQLRRDPAGLTYWRKLGPAFFIGANQHNQQFYPPEIIRGVLASGSHDVLWEVPGELEGDSIYLNGDPIVTNGATQPSISADGQTIVYLTYPTGYNAHDSTQVELYGSGPISVTPDGIPGAGDSYASVLSRNGRFVVFYSDAPDLDPADPSPGIFLRDLTTPDLERVPFPDPHALSADCASECRPEDGCAIEDCYTRQVPLAVSDGGRYVFLADGYPADPLSPRTSSLEHDVGYDTLPCRNAYRLDRETGAFDTVAYGDWFAVDRGGRTITSHPCRLNDNLGAPNENPVFRGFVVRDVNAAAEIPENPGSEILTQRLAQMRKDFGESPATAHIDATYPYYYQTYFADGSVSGDGNNLYYAVNSLTTETFDWEVWVRPVPSPTPPPVVTVTGVEEFQPFTVAYSGMLAETPGDLLALVDANGNLLQAQLTHGSKSGSFQVDGLLPGEYAIDAYYALQADPPILKFRSRTAFTITPKQPVLSFTGGTCEYDSLDLSFSNFLALTPYDRVTLGYWDFGFGTFVPIETQDTGGGVSGTLHFASRLQTGPYQLQVEYGTPDAPEGTRHFVSLTDFSIVPCISKIATLPATNDFEVCRIADAGQTGNTRYAPDTVGLSPDGLTVYYQGGLHGDEGHVFDRRTGEDTIFATSIRGLGVSPGASFLAYASGSHIFVADTATLGAQSIISTASTQGPLSIQVSDDGRWLAHTDVQVNAAQNSRDIVNLWDLSAPLSPQLVANSELSHAGCVPNLSADGRWLVYSRHEYSDQDCLESSRSMLATLVDTSNPQQAMNYCGIPVVPLMPGMDYGYGIMIDAPRVRLSPNGARVIFSSKEPPGAGGVDVLNPPSASHDSFHAYTQLRDGSQRYYVGDLEDGNTMLSILDNGRALFYASGSQGGLFTWTIDDGVAQLPGITDVDTIRAGSGSKRRVAFTGKANGDTATSLYVAPY